MAVQTSPYNLLENNSDSIIYQISDSIKINEELITKYSTSRKIETLMEDLQNGPLVAMAQMGPSFYVDEPFKLSSQICGLNIYGWKPGTERKSAGTIYAIIVGAKKNADKAHVYFMLSMDITPNSKSYIRDHHPSISDKKIYVTSHKTFDDYLIDLYPLNQPNNPNNLEQYVVQLSAIYPLDSILDEDAGERACKAIGQKIFDEYKKNGGYSSGRSAVIKVCERVGEVAKDGYLRKQYIERAWNGVGDSNWSWQA